MQDGHFHTLRKLSFCLPEICPRFYSRFQPQLCFHLLARREESSGRLCGSLPAPKGCIGEQGRAPTSRETPNSPHERAPRPAGPPPSPASHPPYLPQPRSRRAHCAGAATHSPPAARPARSPSASAAPLKPRPPPPSPAPSLPGSGAGLVVPAALARAASRKRPRGGLRSAVGGGRAEVREGLASRRAARWRRAVAAV